MVPRDYEEPIVLNEIIDAALSIEDHTMRRYAGWTLRDVLAGRL